MLNAYYWGVDKMTPEQTMKRVFIFQKCVERDALRENWVAENIICEMERLCMI